jgi:signal transduction histidine kinase
MSYTKAPTDGGIRILFLSHPANTQVLQRQLGDSYTVVAHQAPLDEAIVQQAHMCIIDGPRCLAHHAWFRARKAQNLPMQLPILLLTTQENTFWRETHFADIINETVLMPTDPRVLQSRVKAMLQVQHLQQENNRLSAARAEHVEILLREREVRSQFVAAISHDLRIPLTSTQMAADLLLRGPSMTPKQQKYVHRITASIQRMDKMIHDILDANQLEQGKANTLHIAPGNLGQMLTATVQDWRALYPTRFCHEAYPDVEGYWDLHAIRRALDNLVSNAIKYSDEQSPIGIGIELDAAKQTAKLSVINNGAVIADEQQHRLFQLFHRTPSAVAGNQQGWGIGLAVVRGIAVAHGGAVGVQSNAELGTRFHFTVVSQQPSDASPAVW